MNEYKEQLKNGESREYYYPNLIRILKEKGLKISDLAKAINKDYYQVSRKLNGFGQFNMTDCKKICEVLDASFEEVFFTNYNENKSS